MRLSEARARLAAAGIENAAHEARELFAHFGGYAAAELFAADPCCDEPTLCAAIERRACREPLQYIIGRVFFFDEVYRVSPDCLIPRPDTELLVEIAVEKLPQGAHFADFCTGSGCIAISTLAHRPDATALAVDISRAALSLAEENARANGVSDRLALCTADLLKESVDGEFDAILCNPPYIRTDVMNTLAPELMHEPRIALCGGDDGLIFYRRLLGTYADRLRAGGFFLFEIGYDQAEELCALARAHRREIEIFKDFGGNDRVALVR
ncbi:MAG: peptide chain release factor N(5)-glutamine methyltransferase [Clostridia bacterium]|nr:peptide chain release factor N(5)-glutamine methyltransferase [Clostridia bacterium]